MPRPKPPAQLDLFDPTPIRPKPEDSVPDGSDPDAWWAWFYAANARHLDAQRERQRRRGLRRLAQPPTPPPVIPVTSEMTDPAPAPTRAASGGPAPDDQRLHWWEV